MEIIILNWAPVQIKALRRAYRMTREQFGATIGVWDDTVCRWENGKNRPRDSYQAVFDQLYRDGGPDVQARMEAILDTPQELTTTEDLL